MFGEHVITGAVVSTTWITWLAVALLPQWSVAVHFRVTSFACGQLPGVVTSANVSVGLGSQTSVAVGVAKLGAVGHWIVVGAGSAEITGAVVSTTWITWLAVELLPQWSFAVHVRVTSFACGQLPGVIMSANVSVGLASHASVAVGVAKLGLAGHWIVVGAGSVEITGAVVSTTWITWLAVELLPQWSVAVHFRVTSFACAQVPAVVTSANVSVGVGSHAFGRASCRDGG